MCAVVGYLERYLVKVRALNAWPMGRPRSAKSMAGCSTSAKVLVPHRESSRYQASTAPGTVPASSESLSGILPPWLALYHSMVANWGAVPSALIEKRSEERRVGK